MQFCKYAMYATLLNLLQVFFVRSLKFIITIIFKDLFVWSDKFLNGGNLFTTPVN